MANYNVKINAEQRTNYNVTRKVKKNIANYGVKIIKERNKNIS